jgi:hypothetical protein
MDEKRYILMFAVLFILLCATFYDVGTDLKAMWDDRRAGRRNRQTEKEAGERIYAEQSKDARRAQRFNQLLQEKMNLDTTAFEARKAMLRAAYHASKGEETDTAACDWDIMDEIDRDFNSGE